MQMQYTNNNQYNYTYSDGSDEEVDSDGYIFSYLLIQRKELDARKT